MENQVVSQTEETTNESMVKFYEQGNFPYFSTSKGYFGAEVFELPQSKADALLEQVAEYEKQYREKRKELYYQLQSEQDAARASIADLLESAKRNHDTAKDELQIGAMNAVVALCPEVMGVEKYKGKLTAHQEQTDDPDLPSEESKDGGEEDEAT